LGQNDPIKKIDYTTYSSWFSLSRIAPYAGLCVYEPYGLFADTACSIPTAGTESVMPGLLGG